MARIKEFDPDVAVAAAIEIFWERGYANTSMQDLVDELGLNRGSIYGTFGSKHELFIAALTRYCEAAPQPLLDELARDGLLLPRLRAALIGLIDSDLRDGRRRGCLLVNAAMETLPGDRQTDDLFARTTSAIRLAFESAVRRAQQQGEITKTVRPVDAAAFLLTTLQGLRVMAKASEDRRSLVATVDLALRSLV